MARQRTAALTLGTPFTYLTVLLVVGVTVIPLLFTILGGFRTNAQINNAPAGWPDPWVLSNFTDVFTSEVFWNAMGNSAVIAVIATGLTLVVGSMAAFALSRYTFKGREGLYTLFTIGLLFPVTAAALPLYLLLRELGLLETSLGVALPQAAFALPITIVILRPFMAAIPGELEDAAAMDGASRLGFFWRILLPLSRPALTTVGILAFVTSWNAYLLPLLVLSNPDNFTLPLGVAAFQSQFSQDTAKILAYTAASMIPAIGFFVFAERHIVGGLTGSVKG
ncbi:carbohydrate ABC transporter permease [Dactylosporangium sp. AC04546]|uniref:carbohydrate ABC transporter permease n=1 Tax=Dactylosporangium sp. AC04546 TaxID=2862460 RepID=UPI001EDF4BE6|nr:carbohydrate ABC transporter permease [Dactylosporangium sp. AC04546]WVK87403.1 carbohydrate ABC transporter permease [Dactylosporangium sp. AC04546]